MSNIKEGDTHFSYILNATMTAKFNWSDYPTTLRSSSDAIDLVLKESELGEFEEEREQLERKEVANFIKALTYLLRRNPAIGESFRGRIRFQQV